MPDPKGKLVTPVAFDPDDALVAFLASALGHLVVDAGVRWGAIQSTKYNDVPGDEVWHILQRLTNYEILLSIDLTSDHIHTKIRLGGDVNLAVGPFAHVPKVDDFLSFEALYNSGGDASVFKLGAYDTDLDYYSMFLKRQLGAGTGLNIQYAAGTAATKVGIGITWLEMT